MFSCIIKRRYPLKNAKKATDSLAGERTLKACFPEHLLMVSVFGVLRAKLQFYSYESDDGLISCDMETLNFYTSMAHK